MLERHVRTRRWGRQAFSPGGAADTAEIAGGASFSANFATRLGSVNARGSSGSGSSANVWCVIRSKLAFWSCAKPRHERRDLGPVSVCEFVRRQLPRRPTRVDSRGLGPVRVHPLHLATPPVPSPLGALHAAPCSLRPRYHRRASAPATRVGSIASRPRHTRSSASSPALVPDCPIPSLPAEGKKPADSGYKSLSIPRWGPHRRSRESYGPPTPANKLRHRSDRRCCREFPP